LINQKLVYIPILPEVFRRKLT